MNTILNQFLPCLILKTYFGEAQLFFIWILEGGVQLGPFGTAVTNRPIVPTPGDYDDGEIGGMMIGRGNRSIRRKPAPVPLCPSQIPHAVRTRTRAAAVGNQRLAAWAMARPEVQLNIVLICILLPSKKSHSEKFARQNSVCISCLRHANYWGRCCCDKALDLYSGAIRYFDLGVPWFSSNSSEESWYNTFKYTTTSCFQIFIYSPFMIIFSCRTELYDLCGWNGAVK
jgi:hypothetical protein